MRASPTRCPHADTLPGRRTVCDTCRRARNRARYEANAERVKAKSRAWYAANRERALESQRRYAAAHRAEACERARRWYEANREQRLESLKDYRQREETRERQRAYQREHYWRVKADAKAYARYLEERRLQRRLLAERKGCPLPPVPEERYPAASTKWTAAAAPMRELVREWIGSGGTGAELAAASGVSERLLHRLLHEDSNVSVAAADRIALALGLHLDLIYEETAA